jgi:lysophospholipase L1-like esterase
VGMKRFFIVSAMLLCIFSIVGGHYYYNKKLEQTASAAKLELSDKTSTKEADNKSSKPTADKKEKEEAVFTNAPKEVAQLYKQKKENGESLKIHLVGSKATTTEEGTWAALFTSKMNEVYGQDVEIKVTSFDELTSLDIRNDQRYSTMLDTKSDVFIIEPFLMNDNKGIRVEDTLFVLNQIVDDIKKANEQSVILVQPSNPIYQPQKYADQVKGLKDYAAQEGITYLDHWENWPSVDDEKIKELYNPDSFLPTEKGHQLWADYLINQFK